MKTLTLNLSKDGQPAPKNLRLDLSKGARFSVEVFWDCDPKHADDVDVHALEAVNTGNGAKVETLEQILSTYNTTKMSATGVLPVKADSSFALPSGGLSHSGDKRVQKNTEIVTVDGSKIPAGRNEIPLFVTVHEAEHGDEHEEGHDGEEEAAFSDIEEVTVTIKDSKGKEIAKYVLSDEFAEFNVVQLGSVMLGDNGWEYAPVGRGFTGTFNDVLAYFA